MLRSKRYLSLLLSVCLLLSFIAVPASASTYTKYVSDPAKYTDLKGHWAEEALTNALANGVMYGTTETTVEPDAPLTRAQMAALIVRAFEATKTANVSSFVDMDEDGWYYDYLSRGVQMGILSGNGNSMMPNSKITRQEAACVFCRAFNLYGYTTDLSRYTDSGTIDNFARDAFSACVGAGVLTATEGKLEPAKELTRAEFTYAMYKIVQTYVSSQVPFSGGTVEGSVMVTTPNVTISNSTVSGNMYLGDGVENGSITLDNVQVAGTVYVRGGSKLVLNNNSRANSVVVFNPSYAVSLEADNSSSIANTIIDTAISGVTATGNIGNVTMNTASATLNLKSATVSQLNANVHLPTITVDKDSIVSNILIPSIAEGAKITVDGRVRGIDVKASKVDCSSSESAVIGYVDVDSDDGKFTFSGDIDSVTLSRGASDNTLEFKSNSDVGTFTILSTDNNDITVEDSSNVEEVLFNQLKTTVSTMLKAPNVHLGSKADDSKYTFNNGTSIKELLIDGDNVDVIVKKGASIDTIIVNGYNVDISGDGVVDNIILKKGATGADIDIPNVKVENNSGGSVTVGDKNIPTGNTVETDADGELKGTTTPTDPTNPNGSTDSSSSSFYLEYPAGATSKDIYSNSSYSLSDLVLSGGFNSSTRQMSGTVRMVQNFAAIDGLSTDYGYYFPLVLRSSDRTSDFTVKVGSRIYTQEDLSTGSQYNNQLIFFIPLTMNSSSKTATVTYDADGEGKKFSPASLEVYYSGVQFERDLDATNRMAALTNAPGLNGAPAITVSDFTAYNDTSAFYQLSCTNLTKTRNPSSNEEGYWGGVIFRGPKNAARASYVVRSDTANIVLSGDTEAGGSDYTTFTFYHNMEDCHYLTVIIDWLDANGNRLGSTETYNFDTTRIILVTDGVEGGGDTEGVAIANNISIRAMSSTQVREQFGHELSEFVNSAYNVIDTSGDTDRGAIAGTYNYVLMDTGVSGNLPGPYVPLAITVMGVHAPAEIRAGNTRLGTIPAPSNNDYSDYNITTYVLIPLAYIGSQVQDFSIMVIPSDTATYTTISKAVDASQARYTDASVLMSGATSGTYFGQAYTSLIKSGYAVVTNGTGYDFHGTYNRVSVDSTSGVANTMGWFAPVRVINTQDSGRPWKVTVVSPKGSATGEVDTKVWNVASTTSSLDIAIPLGYYNTDDDSNFYTRVAVYVTDDGDNPLATFYIDATSTVLEGLPSGKTGIGFTNVSNGSGSGVEDQSITASIVAADSNFELQDGYTYAGFVQSGYQLSKVDGKSDAYNVYGSLKKAVVGKNSVNPAQVTEGWAIPLTITLSKVLPTQGSLKFYFDDSVIPIDGTLLASEAKQDFFVPVGRVTSESGNTKYSKIVIVAEDNVGTKLGTVTLLLDNMVLTDF